MHPEDAPNARIVRPWGASSAGARRPRRSPASGDDLPSCDRPSGDLRARFGPSARTIDREVLAVALVVLLLAAALQVTPAKDGVTLLGWRLPEVCGSKRLLGVDCPGCGLTRSFVVGVRGDLAEATRLHPLGAVLLLFTAAQVPYRAARLLRHARGDS